MEIPLNTNKSTVHNSDHFTNTITTHVSLNNPCATPILVLFEACFETFETHCTQQIICNRCRWSNCLFFPLMICLFFPNVDDICSGFWRKTQQNTAKSWKSNLYLYLLQRWHQSKAKLRTNSSHCLTKCSNNGSCVALKTNWPKLGQTYLCLWSSWRMNESSEVWKKETHSCTCLGLEVLISLGNMDWKDRGTS